jgi:oligoribonuclease
MGEKSKRLIWIDLEMTGLELDKERIIEIATLVTDDHLNVVAEGPIIAVKQDDLLLSNMDEWNTKQHGASGLVDRVKASAFSENDAQQQTLDFLRTHVKKNTSPMCGNSICQDRRFLFKYMPTLAHFFHYRNLDVSTLKELAKRWRPDLTFEKESKHLAMDDIKDSIEELKYYRAHFLTVG